MNNCIFSIILLLSFLSFANSSAQNTTESDSSTELQVSDTTDAKEELSTNRRLLFRRNLLYHPGIGSEFGYLPSITFKPFPAGINPLGNAPLSLKIKSDLDYSINMMRQFNSKYDLGVFGEILGYTNAAAALGLAAYHIYKYEIRKKK